MRCNFLSGRYMLLCKIGARPYVPSSFEIREYCKTGRHKVCPLYFSRQDGRDMLSSAGIAAPRDGLQSK
jgi:hypothetical protein